MQLRAALEIRQKYQRSYNLGLLQGKAYRLLEIHLSRLLNTRKLSIPSWKLLGQLFDSSPQRLNILAQILSVKAPLVTVLADQLLKLEFATYETDILDRRAKMMSITDKGKAAILEIEAEVKVLMQNLLAETSLDEKVDYVRVLERIVENSQRIEKKAQL